MNHHRNLPLRCATLATILIASSVAELVTPIPAAHAQIPGANMVNAFGNLVGAGARRRGTYLAADQNQRYFNGYYDRLRDTARTQLVSGQLESLRSTQSGLQRVRTGAYIKVYEATRAEQDAVTRAIEAEKNEARLNFNRTLVREVSNLILSTPGAQQILLQVRTVISTVRAGVIALQSAMAAGQPTNLIREQLANQVRDSAYVQNLVRNLGTMVGQSLDQAMGGALTRVDNALIRAQEEMATAAASLDQMDSQVAALSTERSSVVSGDSTGLGSDIHISDSTMAVLDAASSALGFITAVQGGRGTTRQQMYQQIRYEMLVAHNRHLLQAAEHVSQVDCREVSRSDYEAALGALNESPQTDGATENPTYFVCHDRDSGEPVGAWIGRVTLPTETPAPTTSAQSAGGTATQTSSETRWTLQEADAAGYLSIATRVTSSYSSQMEAACYGEVTITNSLNEIVVGECEDYSTMYDEGAGHRRILRISFHGPESLTHSVGWHTSTLGYETEYYMIRCVAYRNSDAQGYPIPGRWISEAYPDDGSLLESGLTIITIPNPCAR